MKISTAVLTAMVDQAAHFVSKSSTLPVLCNVLLTVKDKKFIVSGTNLETLLKIGTDCDSPDPISPITVDAKDLLNFLKVIGKVKSTLELSVKENKLCINQHVIQGMDSDEFPTMGYKVDHIAFENNFKRLTPLVRDIRKVLWCTSYDQARPALNYIKTDFFQDNSYQLVATNGFTIGISRDTPADPASIKNSYLLSHKVVDGLARLEKLGDTLVCLSVLQDPKDPKNPKRDEPQTLRIFGQSGASRIPGLVWEIFEGVETAFKFPPYWQSIPLTPILTRQVGVSQLKTLSQVGSIYHTQQVSIAVKDQQTHYLMQTESILYHEQEEADPSQAAPDKTTLALINPNFIKAMLDTCPQADTLPLSFFSQPHDTKIDDTEYPYRCVYVPIRVTVPHQACFYLMPMATDSMNLKNMIKTL